MQGIMPLFCTNEKIYQERVEAMKAAIIDDEVRDPVDLPPARLATS